MPRTGEIWTTISSNTFPNCKILSTRTLQPHAIVHHHARSAIPPLSPPYYSSEPACFAYEILLTCVFLRCKQLYHWSFWLFLRFCRAYEKVEKKIGKNRRESVLLQEVYQLFCWIWYCGYVYGKEGWIGGVWCGRNIWRLNVSGGFGGSWDENDKFLWTILFKNAGI